MDRSDQIRDAGEAVASNPIRREVSKESLNDVQPRTACRNEVEVKARMLFHPLFHIDVFVRSVVVEDQMDGQIGRRLPIDLIEKANELLVTMTGHAAR